LLVDLFESFTLFPQH